MKVTISSARCADAISDLIASLDSVVESAIERIGDIGELSAKGTKAYRDRTGNLRRSSGFVKTGHLTAMLIADTPYAAYVNDRVGFMDRADEVMQTRGAVTLEQKFRKLTQ